MNDETREPSEEPAQGVRYIERPSGPPVRIADHQREVQPQQPADATRQIALDRYRVHLMWTAAELDRPHSFRTDVWSTSAQRAPYTASSMCLVMAQETGLHDVEILATMSVEKVPVNLRPVDGPGCTPHAVEDEQ